MAARTIGVPSLSWFVAWKARQVWQDVSEASISQRVLQGCGSQLQSPAATPCAPGSEMHTRSRKFEIGSQEGHWIERISSYFIPFWRRILGVGVQSLSSQRHSGRHCLARTLDHAFDTSPSCPMCRTDLTNYLDAWKGGLQVVGPRSGLANRHGSRDVTGVARFKRLSRT